MEFDDKERNLAKLPEVAGKNKAEVGFIISLLAEYGQAYDMVKYEFDTLFAPHSSISIAAIKQIYNKYESSIKLAAENFTEQMMRCPLANRMFRVRALWKIAKEAMKDKESTNPHFWGATKVGIDTYQEHWGPNFELAKQCIESAEKIMQYVERFEFEKEMAERAMICREVQANIRSADSVRKLGSGRGERSSNGNVANMSDKSKKSSAQEWISSDASADIGMGIPTSPPRAEGG